MNSRTLTFQTLFAASLATLIPCCTAQQTYVGRFDLYGGFTYLESPNINLAERGFHFQAGLRPRSWYTLGFDYSISTGHTDLAPKTLTTALQQQIGGQLAQLVALGRIPPTYSLV